METFATLEESSAPVLGAAAPNLGSFSPISEFVGPFGVGDEGTASGMKSKRAKTLSEFHQALNSKDVSTDALLAKLKTLLA